MNILEMQRQWQHQCDQEQRTWQNKQSNRNLLINLALIFVGTVAALAAWWAALRLPGVPPLPPSAATAPLR